jgi:multisubunit Na+/H+ antiporter MnhB subunit
MLFILTKTLQKKRRILLVHYVTYHTHVFVFYVLFSKLVISFINTGMMQQQSPRPAGKQIVPQILIKRRKCIIVLEIIVSVDLSP